MDLVTAAVNFQSARFASEVQIRVAKKIMDAQNQAGDSAIELLNAASTGMTNAADAMSAAATGLGGQMDTYA